MNDANFRKYMQLLKRMKPWTRARPPWFLFQMWLRRRPMNHEFLVSPIHDYLYSCGIGDAAMMQIKWPAWVVEFNDRFIWRESALMCMRNVIIEVCGPRAVKAEKRATVRTAIYALDTMRGWTPTIDWSWAQREANKLNSRAIAALATP